ncbi:MAG: endonuclease MutS2 [Oscillospiraceae bacterium]|nr:endonuclease MutS2 [Oscillospiraceae bacterium]
MDLFEKSMQTLELPRVLEQLAGQCVCEDAKERARALRPSTDEGEVANLLEETTAARKMMDVQGTPAFSRMKPVSGSLRRASMGGSLNTRELLDICSVLRTTRQVERYTGESREPTCLDGLFHFLQPNRELEERISGAVVAEDEIADNASATLSQIRRKIRQSSGKVKDILQKLVSSPNTSKYLQEAIITIRSDRYVVPVKSEHRNDIPGLVHDVSSSGSTFFIEPLAVVQANNELRELAAQEKQEIERILAELSRAVAEDAEGIQESYDMLVQLDLIFARGKLSYRMRAMEPKLSRNGGFLFRHARHPLLDAKKAVPIDLRLGKDFDTLVITGPNTGGKTVTLKTAGLLTLMAQCGLHLPVDDGSEVCVFRQVLADIGDEQSIEQSLSTFSGHMTAIVDILDTTDERTLVLFDELGAGTDPVEGAALAISIIQEVRSLGAKVIATTHYAELKIFAMTTPGVENASCEFNVETLRPTYRLLIGIPGKSNAFAISRRLGLPEHIIQRAADQMNSENIQFEDVLNQLEQQRQRMEAEQLELRRMRVAMEADAKAAKTARERADAEVERASETARQEARRIIDETRAATDRVFREFQEMKKQQKKAEDWQAANDQRAALRRSLNEADARLGERPREEPLPPTRPAKKGDTVEVLNLHTQAVVMEVNRDGSLQLQAGRIKLTARQDEVRVVEGKEKKKNLVPTVSAPAKTAFRTRAAARELDIRGMMTDEAEGVVARFLDDAVLGKLETVTIIHGKGTGALRNAVHQQLKRSKYVKNFRLGRYGEGENGVTVVELK